MGLPEDLEKDSDLNPTSGVQSPDSGMTTPARDGAVSPPSHDGRWGENTFGEPVSRHLAMEQFEEMNKELSRLTSQKSRAESAIDRIATADRGANAEKIASFDADVERGSSESTLADDFELSRFLKDGHLERRTTAGESAKKIGVLFRNLSVKGVDSSSSFVKTLPQAVLGTFGPDLYRNLCNFLPFLRFGKTPPTRELIHDFTGAVRDGEMMLVLGRPGAGCSTFLKTIANDRSSFISVDGHVSYAGIPADVQDKNFRGEVNYNPEDDLHFANLTVEQTLKFALMNKTKKHDNAGIPIVIDGLLKMFGIGHTRNTFVGNEFLRGVSGGERKRVGIAETLTTKSSVVCWDNSTRGLDASTALDYVKSLRIMTDVSNRTTLVTLYQAGENIYELMDKVLVIEAGRMLYQGPANEAKAYFENLGFYCPEMSYVSFFFFPPAFFFLSQERNGWLIILVSLALLRISLHQSVTLMWGSSNPARRPRLQRPQRNSKPYFTTAISTTDSCEMWKVMNNESKKLRVLMLANLNNMLRSVSS